VQREIRNVAWLFVVLVMVLTAVAYLKSRLCCTTTMTWTQRLTCCSSDQRCPVAVDRCRPAR